MSRLYLQANGVARLQPPGKVSAKVAFKKSSQLSDLISKQDSCMTTKNMFAKELIKATDRWKCLEGLTKNNPKFFESQKKPWPVCSSKFLCEDGVGYIQILRNLPSSCGPKFPLPGRVAPWRVSGCQWHSHESLAAASIQAMSCAWLKQRPPKKLTNKLKLDWKIPYSLIPEINSSTTWGH